MTEKQLDLQATEWLTNALALPVGATPFPWQVELLSRFLAGQPVSALDIPTGLGKTATMAVWLVARALGGQVPRRLVYVVDRRVVVDQATTVAESLRTWVAQDRAVADALGLGDRSLPISTLRGQHVDNRKWLEDPSSPAIVVGTVDMIGSRLLFSGYGVSPKMRPYHAGLLGVDTLVVLDEAHLVPPFEHLLRQIERGVESFGPKDPARRVLIPPFRLLSLSATGRQFDAETLTLSHEDRSHPTVNKRLMAKKTLGIVDMSKDDAKLPDVLARRAWDLTARGSENVRCLVFCNARKDALAVAAALNRLAKSAGAPRATVELLVGARRVYERTQVVTWLVDQGFLEREGQARNVPDGPAFLVATSAGEVGVDMDADQMVCDLVPWERMVQRLGRVNRRGQGDAQVIVVYEDGSKDGERLERVRNVLVRLPPANGGHDASPGALTALKASGADEIEAASTPAPLHPPLSRAVLESWSMTSLEEHTGRPEVQPWIRGWIDEEEPQTTVVFRRVLPVDDEGRLLADGSIAAYLDAAPPHLNERLETETWQVIEWLDGRGKHLAKARAPENQATGVFAGGAILGLVVDGSTLTRELRLVDLIDKSGRKRLHRDLAGRLLLLDARIGGLRQGLLEADHDEASDVGDLNLAGAPALPFRIALVGDESPAGSAAGPKYREEVRLCLLEDNGADTRWLVIETLADAGAQSEDGRSVTPAIAQFLVEHEEWTEQEARILSTMLGLVEPYGSVLALAASLHDEGKRARNWQKAFGVADAQLRSGQVYAKTVARPNLALLGRYRHELGSFLHAERDARVQALAPEHRDLCLHLIAAHHGFARPLLRTDGAEVPPSMLIKPAQEIALRFSKLEKAWGPWALAWWESLLRAADQRASRRNDERGVHG